jgi:H+/Cl- antiporter ClcA
MGYNLKLCFGLPLYPWFNRRRSVWLREPQTMTQQDFFTLYFASLGIIGGLAGYVITHLLSEIKRLNSRVDEIYNILLER